jgi:hypothetical protein
MNSFDSNGIGYANENGLINLNIFNDLLIQGRVDQLHSLIDFVYWFIIFFGKYRIIIFQNQGILALTLVIVPMS